MTRYRDFARPLLIASASILATLMTAGCTDLKPVQAQIDDLKSQISKVSGQTTAAESQARAAADAARSAETAAQHAQGTADFANSTANQNQQAIEAINEKIDRMFRKSVSK
jgi:hypothetical protein